MISSFSLASSFRPVTVGVIGCGNIFNAYAKGCSLFRILKLKACADLNPEAAKAKAEEFGITAMPISDLLADPEIEIIINLTIPKVHAEVSMDILRAGKHAYSEKPLAVTFEEGHALWNFAKEKGLRLGCAPDTFLGAGYQTCRKVIDDGWIGKPLSGTAFMMSRGPEGWHPNPGFFYQKGAGPMMDMGPYYVTALIHLLGPVKSVFATTTAAANKRLATSKERLGENLPVEIPTHYAGNLLFHNGTLITMVMSFDVLATQHKNIEIHGSQGSLQAPDPNTFGGPVSIYRCSNEAWEGVPLLFDYKENSRSIGVADMAHAILANRPHRCNGSLALHALEVMTSFQRSHEKGGWVDLESTCEQPAPFPTGLPPQLLDS